MSVSEVFLAVDLGASSGRVVAGKFDADRLELEEVHRFENGPVVSNDHMYWDILGLWSQIQQGLRLGARHFGSRVQSIGVDTWGVDFCLLGPGDEFLGNPYHYRDCRTAGMMERAFETVSRERIFAETGLQFMELNTLYQLLAIQAENPELLAAARGMLMIPDLFHWLLSGEKVNEATNASTTQLFSPASGGWSERLIDEFKLPSQLFLDVVPAGTELGRLRSSVARSTGLSEVKVMLPGTHDTASAVVAVPAVSATNGELDWCYISSGTWSLMGIESASPIINARCRELNFTNEGGVAGTTRVLKNIAGLWLVQECRRIWSEQGTDYDWDELVELARSAPSLQSLIDPDGNEFVSPASMPDQIREYCRRTGQVVPETAGEVVRAALESLALRYRAVHRWLEELAGAQLETIHVVGGGTQNELLCQMTADACNRTVLAGPVEATAIGNLIMQAVATGRVGSISEGRSIVRGSFPIVRYEPRDSARWDQVAERFSELN